LPSTVPTATTNANISTAITINTPTAVFVFTNVSLCYRAAAAAAAVLPLSCRRRQVATALPAALLPPLMPRCHLCGLKCTADKDVEFET
jgi:hypothetical protein